MDYMGTDPTQIDLFTRYMQDKIDNMTKLQVGTGFQTMFDKGEMFSYDAEVLDVGIRTGSRSMAQLIPRGVEGALHGDPKELVTSNKFTEVSRVFPLIEDEAVISKDETQKRTIGETPYRAMTPTARLLKKAVERANEMVKRTIRTNEYLAAQALITGKMVAKLGSTDTALIYDFKRDASHTTTTTGWLTSSSLDVIGDLDAGCTSIIQKAELMPDFCLMGVDAWSGFLANLKNQGEADYRRVEQIAFNMNTTTPDIFKKWTQAGFNYICPIKTNLGRILHIFTNETLYKHYSTGTDTPYLDPDYCVIGSSQAENIKIWGPKDYFDTPESTDLIKRYFGSRFTNRVNPTNVLGRALNPRSLFFDATMSTDKKTINIRLQNAPLYVLRDPNAVFVYTNAGAAA